MSQNTQNVENPQNTQNPHKHYLKRTNELYCFTSI